MAMPEAAVDEDDGFVFGQEDVNGDRAGLKCRLSSSGCRVPDLFPFNGASRGAWKFGRSLPPHPGPLPWGEGELGSVFGQERDADVETEAEAEAVEEGADDF